MTVFAGEVDATFAAFGVDVVYTPASGEPIPVRVIARRPDTIVGFGETRIHARTTSFEVRTSEVASPRPDHQRTWAARRSSGRSSASVLRVDHFRQICVQSVQRKRLAAMGRQRPGGSLARHAGKSA